MAGTGVSCWSCAIVKIPCFLPAGDGRGKSKIRTLRAWSEEDEGTLDDETKSRRIMQALHLASQTERPTWDRSTDLPPQLENAPGGSFIIQGRSKLLAPGLTRIKIIGPNPPLVAGPSHSGAAAPVPDPEIHSRSGSRSEKKRSGEELGEGEGGDGDGDGDRERGKERGKERPDWMKKANISVMMTRRRRQATIREKEKLLSTHPPLPEAPHRHS
jgi:hypothetical protein